MSSHDPKTSAERDERESPGGADAGRAADARHTDRATGVKHDPELRKADRLARLGNEEEKPADDRFGD
jgi:hypothetical protein